MSLNEITIGTEPGRNPSRTCDRAVNIVAPIAIYANQKLQNPPKISHNEKLENKILEQKTKTNGKSKSVRRLRETTSEDRFGNE